MKFCELYVAAHNNAVGFLEEAELLLQNGRHARAYFCAFTGLEEIAKSQLAADVYSGFVTEEKFKSYFVNHSKKIGRVAWATLDAKDYREMKTDRYLDIAMPELSKRMSALYVDQVNGVTMLPKDVIDPEEARSLIHTLRVAIERIIEIENFTGRIGTKGFMK
jgi:AbiV family abortive infection protein